MVVGVFQPQVEERAGVRPFNGNRPILLDRTDKFGSRLDDACRRQLVDQPLIVRITAVGRADHRNESLISTQVVPDHTREIAEIIRTAAGIGSGGGRTRWRRRMAAAVGHNHQRLVNPAAE